MKQGEITQRKKDSDGRVIIEMVVKDDIDFLSTYCEKGSPIISEGVAEFLEHSTQTIAKKEQLSLKIHSDCIDEEEKIVYKEAVKNYYSSKLVYTNRELELNRIIAIVLGFLGILTIILAQIVAYKFDSVIWAEVIDIAAWVFLWETVDILAFKTRSMRLEKRRQNAFINMKIEYLPLSK